MIKKILLPAFILTIPTSIITLVKFTHVDVFSPHSVYHYLSMVCGFLISFSIFCFFIRKYKMVYSNGNLSFGEAFKYGLKITVAWGIMVALLASVLVGMNKEALHEVSTKSVANAEQNLIDESGSISASQQQTMQKSVSIQQNPFALFGLNMLIRILLGIIHTLIAASIFKTKPVE